MKKIIRTFTITLLLFSVSCADLDQDVYSEIAVDNYTFTADDMDKLMAPTYWSFSNVVLGFHPALTQSISSDHIAICSNASGWDDGCVFKRMHRHTWNSEQSHVWAEWDGYYQSITSVNRVLDQFERIPGLDEDLKKRYNAEMRAVRSYCYWRLLDQFKEMPLVTSFTDTELPMPATRQEIYNFVESELTEILPSLSAKSDKTTYGRFNQWAARAVLVYLYLNAAVYTGTPQWEKCIQHSDAIINS